MLHRIQLPDQPANRLRAVGYRANTAHLAIRFRNRDRDRLGMDIQAQESYLFLHDRFLSACGSELCFFLNHSPTHG